MEKGELFRIVAVGRGGRSVSVGGGEIPTSLLSKREAQEALKKMRSQYQDTGVRLRIRKDTARYKWRG